MSSPDIQSLLSGMLSNPEMLGSIMKLASSLSSSNDSNEDTKVKGDPPSPPSESADLHQDAPGLDGILSALPLLSSQSSFKSEAPAFSEHSKSTADRRRALLWALKPFLSEKRSEKIDFILKVLALLDAAEGFNKFKL